MQQTFSLQFLWLPIPRALPWASMPEPVGLIGEAVGFENYATTNTWL